MALTDEQLELLENLETATNQYADRELRRLQRRANLLRRLNTRIDDFAYPVEREQIRLAISDINALIG